jgi:dTDP-4-dehydrorhamnose 3,5-epimerase
VKIVSVQELSIPAIKVIRFARFADQRGYFTETYRHSDFNAAAMPASLQGQRFVQGNESFSRAGVVRGLHFQWNPYMGKLVRTVRGRMVDLVLDIRKGSPTYGKIIAHDMPSAPELTSGEWIWVPPGFAHGNFFTEDSQIEYFCTGEWNPACEAGISPLARDLDWSQCDRALKAQFDAIVKDCLISPKDRDGLTLAAWTADERSRQFAYSSANCLAA